MPKSTFLNLDSERQDAFIKTALREFTLNNYDDASISRILKELGIAKGSFYQYFENKRDLFDYLIQVCFETKQKYLFEIQRDSFDSFWSYWRALYVEGLKFDEEHPFKSNFSYFLFENLNSPTVRELYTHWQQQGFEVIKQMIKTEVENGCFRKDIPLETVAMFVLNVGKQIVDQLRMRSDQDFGKRILEGRSLIVGGNEAVFLQVVDDSIALLSSALDKK